MLTADYIFKVAGMFDENQGFGHEPSCPEVPALPENRAAWAKKRLGKQPKEKTYRLALKRVVNPDGELGLRKI